MRSYSKKHLRTAVLFFGVILQLAAFQNCTNGFQSPQSGTQNNNSTTTTSATPSTPDTPGTPSSPALPSLSQRRTPADFGAVGDCVTDDSEALQRFFNVGGLLAAPRGSCYRVSRSIKIPSNIVVVGEGKKSLIKIIPPAGTRPPIVPVLDLAGSGSRSTARITLKNFAVDGGYDENANRGTGNFAEQAINNDGMAPAILVQSSDSLLENLWVSNAYDNGIGVYQTGCNDNALSQCNNQPRRVTVTGVTCNHNGYGGKKLGGCIDLLTARESVVSDSVDYGSSSGFILDYWGGAQGTFKNLKSYNARLYGFYIGAPGSTFENLESHNAGNIGVWIDAFADNPSSTSGTIKDLVIRDPGGSAMQIQSRNWILTNTDISGVTPTAQTAAVRYAESYLPNNKVLPNPASSTTFLGGMNEASRVLSFYSYSGFALGPGQRYGDKLGSFFLIMQTDGNLVLYRNSGGLPLWSSDTAIACGANNCSALYKNDGSLLIQDQSGRMIKIIGKGSGLHFSSASPFLTIDP